ncbi:MAG: right-handed parallel beta-helix repeat-containing protein [Chitinophagaceae bacterium]
MKSKYLLCLLLCVHLSVCSFATTYYLSSSGNDSNSGLSSSNAWKTIQKLNTIDLQPGDIVLFEGGSIFTGNIFLDQQDAGTSAQPVTISSYATGKAIINANNGLGIKTYNCAGIRISNLAIQGSGIATNTGSGIDIYMDVAFDLSFIRIDSCDVSGFRGYGIQIGCWDTNNGFNDVHVRYVNSFNNGSGGMTTYGYNNIINHQDFYVGYSIFHDNKGRADVTTTHTGNGIVLSAVENAMIEYCEAYNNGENNAHPTGGPVGIWFSLVRNGIIQFCESHHNRSATFDGGGFDLDGGSQNCIIQYCYSHDNVGAGFLMAEYGSGVAFTNNIIRYNISQNDARKGLAGAITFWGVDASNRINQSYVYNNSIFLNTDNASGTPAAVKLIGNNFSGVKLSNNVFYTSGNVQLVNADTDTDSTMLHFLFNDYYSASGQPVFTWAWNVYNNLAAWKAAAVTQERRGLQQSGMEVDPLMIAPGSSGTVGLAQLQQLATYLTGYRLQPGSGMVDGGLDVNSISGLGIGARDFFGNSPHAGAAQDIGAHECADCYIVLPNTSVLLNAIRSEEGVKVSWTIKDPSFIKEFIIEYSLNGREFTALNKIPANPLNKNYEIIDTMRSQRANYYRLLVIQTSGRSFYSKIISVSGRQAGLMITPIRSGNGYTIMINSPVQQQVIFSVLNSFGELLQRKTWSISEGISYHNMNIKLLPGMYLLNITDATGRSSTVQLLING